eukprot:PhF_6_TR7971/c0_g1_i2/m.12126
MLSLTVSLLYLLHFIAGIFLCIRLFLSSRRNNCTFMPSRRWIDMKYKWIRAVMVLQYPNLTIRYQLSVVLPLVATATGSFVTPIISEFRFLMFMNIAMLVSFFMVLVLLCYVSYSQCTYINPPPASSCENQSILSKEYFLVQGGKWTPKISLANGGTFFSQYTYSTSSPSFLKPYVWIWTTMILGAVLTVVASD